MKVFLCDSGRRGATVRSSLLRRSLREHWRRAGGPAAEIGALSDDGSPVALLASLPAFARPRQAAQALFVGIANSPVEHLGRNVLVCARELSDELADFADRNPGVRDIPMWWTRILRNFERVLLLDRAHVAESASFSPWTRLGYVDHLPVLFPNRRATTGNGHPRTRVLVIQHGSDRGFAEVRSSLARVSPGVDVLALGPDASGPCDLDALFACAVHVHLGYDRRRASAFLDPLDSMMNGAYTAVLASPGKEESLGADLRDEAAARSYALVAPDPAALVRFVERSLSTMSWLGCAGAGPNPELQRFQAANRAYASSRFDHLLRQVLAA